MALLLLSICTLFAGPLFARFFQTGARARLFLDSFSLAAIGGIALLHILPASFHAAGFLAPLALLLGLVLPLFLHFIGADEGPGPAKLTRATFPLALLALALHAFLDGTALRESDKGMGWMLAVAVILHRFPVGLGVWRLSDSLYGKKEGFLSLAAIALTTLLGFLVGAVPGLESKAWLGLFQAFLAGTMLHLFLQFPPIRGRAAPGTRTAYIAGAFGAFALLLALEVLERFFFNC